MKFIHTADWHLGRIFYETYLTADQEYVLAQFIDLVERERPAAVIIAGDLYDRAVPPAAAVKLLDDTLAALMDLAVPVIAISGNHDSTERIDFGSRFMRNSGIYMYGLATPATAPVVLEDEAGPVYICPFAFADPARVRIEFGAEEVRDYADLFKIQAQYLREQVPAGVRSVAVAHAFVAGGLTSDSERPLSVGGSSQVPADIFADFNYTMLGHLHRPQNVGSDKIRYSGSLLKYSFDEAAHEKGIDIVTMDASGNCQVRTEHLQPKYDMRVVEGSFAELMSAATPATEDYLLARLTDTSPVLDAMGRLRSKFPNILGMEPIGAMRPADSRVAADFRRVSQQEMFAEFVERMSGMPLTATEETLMADIWQEILEEERQ